MPLVSLQLRNRDNLIPSNDIHTNLSIQPNERKPLNDDSDQAMEMDRVTYNPNTVMYQESYYYHVILFVQWVKKKAFCYDVKHSVLSEQRKQQFRSEINLSRKITSLTH